MTRSIMFFEHVPLQFLSALATAMDKLDNKIKSIVDGLKKKHLKGEEKGKNKLILILQDLQEEFGYLPRKGLSLLSEECLIPPNHVYGVTTFHHQFR